MTARGAPSAGRQGADHWILGRWRSIYWGRWVSAFVQHLRELGWTKGKSVAIEYHWAEGSGERMTEIAVFNPRQVSALKAWYRLLHCMSLNMHIAAFVTLVAIVIASAVPTSADDHPSDPFGNHTVELNKEAPLVAIWEFLRDQMLLDKARFHSCIETGDACPEVSTLIKIVEEARQYQGKALLGHLNRSINLMIKAAPGDWTGPLEAITMKNGDCKSYSVAKYAAVRAAGISPDHVRLVIVHDRRHNVDHMVAAVFQDEEWLILDNLTNLVLRDSDKTDYEPTAILDYTGVRRYLSAFWMF